MEIQTVRVIDPDGPKYRFIAGRLEALETRAFDLPGSHCRFDRDEIEKLLDGRMKRNHSRPNRSRLLFVGERVDGILASRHPRGIERAE
jgi:hypothetical protein